MFFKARGRFSVISHRRAKPEISRRRAKTVMRDDLETSSSFRKLLSLW